jgi:protein-tyrosine phosphatase
VNASPDIDTTQISLAGLPNFRDLGGHISGDGRRVRRGRLFRSQAFSYLTEADYDAFHRSGIQLVCDLRGVRERERRPNRFPPAFVGQSLELAIEADLRANGNSFWDLIDADPTPAAARHAMEEVYATFPEAFATVLPPLLESLLERQQIPAVIHCTAGKDRTGFTCALLLFALDVPEEVIYRDYLRSAELFTIELAAHDLQATARRQRGIELDREILLPLVRVERSYLDRALQEVRRRFGSVDNYLHEVAGLDRPRRQRLRELLLEG